MTTKRARKRSPPRFNNLDKTFWPEKGYTKGDLITYYESVARYILPYLKDRPVVLNRFPDGIAGQHFFQKDVELAHPPKFLKRVAIKAQSGKVDHYVLCNDRATLRWLANFGAIELHPWASRTRTLRTPDFLIMDLDPGKAPFGDCIAVAREMHSLLDSLKIPNYCKTSGKTGLHVYVPLCAKYDYEKTRAFGKLLARAVNARLPKITTTEQRIAKRGRRVFLDYLRNSFGQTAVAPYSARPTREATVSTPLRWREVARGLDPEKFTIKTIRKRLAREGDLWKPTLGRGADCARATARLEKEL